MITLVNSSTLAERGLNTKFHRWQQSYTNTTR